VLTERGGYAKVQEDLGLSFSVLKEDLVSADTADTTVAGNGHSHDLETSTQPDQRGPIESSAISWRRSTDVS